MAGRHAPITVRVALRDLARYRARSGSALAAISFAVLMAVFISILATARFADPFDYFGPNLRSNQLIVYAHGANQGGPGEPSPAPPRPQDMRAQTDAIATAVGSTDILELDSPGADILLIRASNDGFRSAGGTLYVATPALLARYGITPDQVDPNADILTSRDGLARMTDLALLTLNRAAPPSGCASGTCIAHPRIQTLHQLPTDISAPNLLITEHALRHLDPGARQTPAGWLIQTARPLTPVQVNTARQMALGAGGTIETRSQNPSLDELRNWATAGGILIALGVLAVTVGLIRGEAAGELRTLTAIGANRRIRRTLTGATAGGLGLLGAILGTVVAYVAASCFYRGSLSTTVSHVPVNDLIAILVGLPLAATLGGWLFAGREPHAIARKPLD
jgi:putative ABC transport system permease protein